MSCNKNSIIKCLGKSLKTELKAIAICRNKFFDKSGVEIKKEQGTFKQVLCMGLDKIYFLQGDLHHLIEYFEYEEIEGIEIDNKNQENFNLWLSIPTIGSRHKIKRILINAKFRGVLIKNLICYYSIYHQIKYADIKEIKLALSNYDLDVNIKEKLGIKKGISKYYKQIQAKGYEFYIKYYIVDNYNNSMLKIVYEESTPEIKKKTSNKNNVLTESCTLNIDISDVFSYDNLEQNKNSKDLMSYAYTYAIEYIKNIQSSQRFWILSSKIHNKKYNFNEDICMWEGWRIEARTSEPEYLNIVFIILRRKFLPPFYDSYQCFHFILIENYSRENFNVNPKAYEVIELASNSICYSSKMNEKEYSLFLKAKQESLLLDEETLLFFQNSLNIITPEIYELGFKFVYSLLVYIELNTKDKSKISPIRQSIEQKIKALNSAEFGFTINLNDIVSDPQIFNSVISDIIALYSSFDSTQLKQELFSIDDDQNKNTVDYIDKEKLNNKIKQRERIRQVLAFERKKVEVWKRKCYRYLTFCLNGGLSDYMLTIEMFIEFVNKLQNSQNSTELNDLIVLLLNITDLDLETVDEPPRIYIPSLNERSNFIYNEDFMYICIRKGWLNRYLSENIKHTPSFIKLLLKNHLNNRLLSSINHFLINLNDQTGEEGSITEERNAYIVILKPLSDIYNDIRQSPLTLTLSAKCLCNLIIKKHDKKNKIILIQEDIISKISYYLEYYDFDEKLVITSLELFRLLSSELKSKINEYISDVNGVNMIRTFKNILKGTRVPGSFYSQKIQAEVIQVILTLTNNVEAGIQERLNSNNDIGIYNSLINLVDDSTKSLVVDYREELSYTLEFRAFYLLGVLVFKNEKAKDYLFNRIKIKEFIENKSDNYRGLIINVLAGIKNKNGFPDNRVSLIGNTIKRYYEFIYFLIMKDSDKIVDFKKNCPKFNQLLELMNKNRVELGFVKEFDVYSWFNRLYRDVSTLDSFN